MPTLENIREGLGKLTKVPYFVDAYRCCKCKRIFFLSSTNHCHCGESSKYKAKPIMVGKYRCDSLNEGRRFSKLVWLYRNHSITELEIHPAFEMVVAGKKICTYEADFRFRWNGVRLTEDVKGHETKDFKLKKKLFEALYPKEILVMVNV